MEWSGSCSTSKNSSLGVKEAQVGHVFHTPIEVACPVDFLLELDQPF
jgi:hypothetical protein